MIGARKCVLRQIYETVFHYINVQGYEEERTFYAANLRNWDAILGELALKTLKAIININDNMLSIQPPGMARYDLIMLQKTGNDSIRSAAMQM